MVNQSPEFAWPDESIRSIDETTPRTVVTTIKNLMKSIVPNETLDVQPTNAPELYGGDEDIDSFTETIRSETNGTFENIFTTISNNVTSEPATTENIMHTSMPSITTTVTEKLNDNATNTVQVVIDGINSTVKNLVSSLTTAKPQRMTEPVPTSISLNETANSNSSVVANDFNITETSNKTMEGIGSTIKTVLEDVTTKTISNVSEVFVNTTEKIFGNSTKVGKNSKEEDSEQEMIVYIILGVLIAVLIIIIVSLYVCYTKHKKCNKGSGDYYVSHQMKDYSNSSIKTNSEPDTINVKM